MSEEIVNALLENDEPKRFAARVPTLNDEAVQSAVAQFNAAADAGRIHSARTADEIVQEIVYDVCEEFGIDPDNEDNFEDLSTPLFKLAADMFPGNW